MSVIAVRRYDDHIMFASDSIRTYGSMHIPAETSKPGKMFEVNDLTIGGVGSTFEINMMQIFARTHKPEPNIPSVVDFMMEFRAWLKSKDGDKDSRAHYIIAVQEQMYHCMDGIESHEIAEYAAIGAGEDFALTALHLGHDVERSVQVACELSVWCHEPIKTIRHAFPQTSANT